MPQAPIGLLHLADVHLGAAAGPTVPAELARALARERLEALDAALAEAVRGDAAAVLVAGDLLEERYATREHAAALAERFAAAARPVVVVPGNHDPAGVRSYYRTLAWPANVVLLLEERWTAHELADLPLVVHGLGWTGGAMTTPAPQGLEFDPGDGRVHVVLTHADLDPPGGRSPYRPLTTGEVERLGASYVALGHIHAARRLTSGQRVLAAYPGSLTPLGFGEPGRHGALWVEIDPGAAPGGPSRAAGAARITALPVARRAFHTVDVVLGAECDEAEWVAACVAALPAGAAPDDLARFRLQGTAPPAGADPVPLQRALGGRLAHVELEDLTLPDFDLDRLVAAEPHGIVARFVETLRARARDAQGREAAGHGAGVREDGAPGTGLRDADGVDPIPGAAAAARAGGALPDPGTGDDPALEPPGESEVLELALRYGVQALTGRRVAPL